ncbi:ribonuclease H [Elysia marginata]|uniref:Ribonuclease H n=1 Tax=Elysia marginata TaxID=1093978 RepID=A0AAV4H1R9_9GAST|nr:ribonuclease H [Elysia marginata]
MDLTNKHLDKKYPMKEWIRIYTDGSATDAVRNGGCGVYATLPDGTTFERSFAFRMSFGLAVRHSLKDREVRVSIPGRVKPRTLELVLAECVISVPDSKTEGGFTKVAAGVGEHTLQWMPGRSNIEGNEKAEKKQYSHIKKQKQ